MINNLRVDFSEVEQIFDKLIEDSKKKNKTSSNINEFNILKDKLDLLEKRIVELEKKLSNGNR